MAIIVSKLKFFNHVNKFDWVIKDEDDRVNAYTYDSYVDEKTGKEIGFISYHASHPIKYHIH